MSRRFVVTGGAGFIGCHLVRALLARGDAVTVVDNFSTGRPHNLADLHGPLDVVEGSVADATLLARALQQAAGVFHLAAVPSVPRSIEFPLDAHANNATGTVCVLDAARQQRLRVIYAGSSSAYGNQAEEHKHEAMREDPLSPYAASKIAGELYCRAFARVYGLPVMVTRFFNVFGPRQQPDSPYAGVVAAFCHALLQQRRPRIDGDGRQSRDFTYVEDLVGGLLRAMAATTAGCEIVNLAYGESHTLLDLLATLSRHAGVTVEPEFGPPRRGDVRHSQADVQRAKSILGYAPEVGFVEGLRRTFDWYRSQHA